MTGTDALAVGDWEAARAEFEQELGAAETAEAHDGLGRALWWLGDPDGAIEHRERAFVLLKERGERRRAAGVAVWLAREHLSVYGNDAVANGWLARAQRLLADDEGSSEHGWLELARGRRNGSTGERERAADLALEIAGANRDADLEVAALAELGLAAIERGDVAVGLDRLDEAMATATGGEADLPETIAEACCSLVAACELAGDAGRLAQWARIVETLLERRSDLPSLAFCRTCNAELLAAVGRRHEAEVEFLASSRELAAAGHRSRCVDPAVKLAEVRLLQGRLEEAQALLDGREGLPEATVPLSDLYLAKGEPALATAVLLRRLHRVGDDGLLRAPLLERLVDAQLEGGQGAAATAAELAGLAEASGHPMVMAYADAAVARVDQDPAGAIGHLQSALDRFTKLQMPIEAARTRFALATRLQHVDRDVAADHAGRAAEAFAALGATREADRAMALVRTLGGRARTGPKGVGVLTAREQEVLRLLGEGLSNAEIAARLYISTKTAGHHVGNILAKLHLRNRQEAAAYAIRTLGGEPAQR
jgi:DNA-binding CsgD family transcriptional regulator